MTNLMKYWNLVFMTVALVFASCKNDDNGNGVETVPPKLLGDVSPEDDAKIRDFLETHFYNYEDFDPATQPADFDFKIKIDTLAGENADKRPMSEDAQSITVNVSSTFLGLSDGEEAVPHKLYYIEAREGGGGSPTYADSTLITYKGSLLNGDSFDQSQDFTWHELYNRVQGFAQGIPNLKAASPDQFIEHGDGTFSFGDSGIGLLIFPSGLGYFNSVQGSIPSYS